MSPEVLQRKRRVSMTVAEIFEVIGCLNMGLLIETQNEAMKALRDRLILIYAEEHDAEHQRINAAYRAAVDVKDCEAELDDDAEVSPGDDPGAYVMVWRWVSDEDAGLCRTCKAAYNHAGDGWDGECPDCADKTEAARVIACESCGKSTRQGDSPDGENCPDCADRIVDDKHAAQMADLSGDEGQDRESYSDDQDRDSYTVSK